MKLSEVLYNAACDISSGQAYFCCHAIRWGQADPVMVALAENYLAGLGMPLDGSGFQSEFSEWEDRQQVRFAWLMFAAQIAEEDGL